MRVRHILFCLAVVLATATCTPRQEVFSTVTMVWNRHTPAAIVFYTYAAGGDMAQTQKLEIKFHPSKSDEELLDSVAVEEIDVALLTAAQALLLLNAEPTWRIIADLGPTTPLAILSREAETWRERREWVNFADQGGRLQLASWTVENQIDFSTLTIHEALPLTNPAGNTGATLVQLAYTPLSRPTLAHDDLHTVAALPQRLLLLGKTEYIKRHPQGVRRLLEVWKISLQKFREQANDPLPNLAEQMNTDVDYLRKLLEEHPLPSGSITDARKVPTDFVRLLEKLTQAGKERGLLRRSFNPRAAIP
ncbi:MAG TPA: hypothetical protein PK961_01540 [bacterium]|nr:hypothetical protein [bacterium]